VECDLVWYGSKVETIVGICSWNLLNKNNIGVVWRPSNKDHLQINSACIGMQVWRNQMKVQGFDLA
jgi:hypothetical protein